MKKWFKKLLIGASVSLMALIGLFATLIFYPNNVFAGVAFVIPGGPSGE